MSNKINFTAISQYQTHKSGLPIYMGIVTIKEISKANIPNDANVREYMLDGQAKKRYSNTHLAIKDTLNNQPASFVYFNSGIVITASRVTYNTSNILTLEDASIINGAQTLGIIKEHLNERAMRESQGEKLPPMPEIGFQIIVANDKNLVADISIARNHQLFVKAISIMGAKGQLNDLEKALGQALRKSESDRTDKFVPTEKLLEVIIALIPQGELWNQFKKSKAQAESRVFTYTNPSICLRMFSELYNDRQKKPELYKFFLDMAKPGWALYQRWKTHQIFMSWYSKEKAGVSVHGHEVTSVADGITMPIVCAHSAFIRKAGDNYMLSIPDLARTENALVHEAKLIFDAIEGQKPAGAMGRNPTNYMRLLSVANTVVNLAPSTTAIAMPKPAIA